jgi:hypothetical protein
LGAIFIANKETWPRTTPKTNLAFSHQSPASKSDFIIIIMMNNTNNETSRTIIIIIIKQ